MTNLPTSPAASQVPVCPRHQVPARKSKSGGWYCPKGDHGRWCTERWPDYVFSEGESGEENGHRNGHETVEKVPEKTAIPGADFPPFSRAEFHEQIAKLDLLTNVVGQLVNLVFKLRADLVPGATAVTASTAVESFKALKAVNQPFLGEAVNGRNGLSGSNGLNGLNGLSRTHAHARNGNGHGHGNGVAA